MKINDPHWAYLLRIGVDLTGINTGGFHGPIFEDGSFEFIPIPYLLADESYAKTVYGQFTYGKTIDRKADKPFITYVTNAKIRGMLYDAFMHPDPDFLNSIYGDIAKTDKMWPIRKAASLVNLKPGNLLVFCASLDPFRTDKYERALYVIGYFLVEKVYNFQQLTSEERWETVLKFREANPHCVNVESSEMNEHYIKNLVLVEGDKNTSTLLKKAVQLTDRYYRILPVWTEELGLNSTLFTRGGRWLPQKDRYDLLKRRDYLSRLREVLEEHGRYQQQLRCIQSP